MNRSMRPDVRNPILALPAMRALAALPSDQRALIARLLGDIIKDCRDRAQKSWRQNKAPMACYWKVNGVYAYHIKRAIRP